MSGLYARLFPSPAAAPALPDEPVFGPGIPSFSVFTYHDEPTLPDEPPA